MFLNKYREIRSGWALALSMVVMTVGEMLIGIVVYTIIFATNILQNASDTAFSVLNNWLSVLFRVLLIFGLFLLFKFLFKRPVREMGLTKNRWLSQLAYGLLFGIVSIGAVFGLLLLTGQAKVSSVDWSIGLSHEFWASFGLFVSVGFFEEILSRGYMMTALKTTRSKPVIILLPAVLFSCLHLLNPNTSFLGLFNIFLVGILFAYMFIRTGKLWMPIGYHITWNFFQGNIFGMAVSGTETVSIFQTRFTGPDWVTGGAFGAEGGIVVTAVILLGLLFIRFCVRKPEPPEWTMDSGLPMPFKEEKNPSPLLYH